jgi:Excreted virulence factor EspC, type VII ESX diderm
MSVGRIQVTPEELAAAGGTLGRCTADLDAAAGAVKASADAAAGTPVEGIYDRLAVDAGQVAASLQTAAEDLSRALGQAASNYSRTEQANAACYAPGAAR